MERLAIHGKTKRMKLNPSERLIRIEGVLSGGQDRVDQGQEGTGRGRKDGSESSWRISSAVIETTMIFSSLKNINLALVGVPSRRLVIRETVFRVPDLTPLPYVQEKDNSKLASDQHVSNRTNEPFK